ncbi:MAG: AraC family transcriptional regulator [Clostridiaceae bacterium]|nr:AraC family transcriptional regulator [Clostridiaceae bacterium]
MIWLICERRDMNCRFDFIYKALREAGTSVGFHKHDGYELVYYLNGSGMTTIGDQTYSFGPNQFTIIKPHCVHDEHSDKDTQVIFTCFHTGDDNPPLKNGLYHDSSSFPILHYLQQMRAELMSRQKKYETKLDLILSLLLIDFDRLDSTNPKSRGDLSYAISFLQENYHQPVDMAMLADLSGYSYHRFRHLFKQKTGFAPNDYLIKQRLKQARALLADTRLSIAAIAQECFFYNESQLSMMFKRQYGLAPSLYRKQNNTDTF